MDAIQCTSLEEFVCRLYGFKKINDVNEVRFALFTKTYQTMTNTEEFSINYEPRISVMYGETHI